MNLAGKIRSSAQLVRHSAWLSRMDFFWRFVRPCYRRVIETLGKNSGVEVMLSNRRILVDPAFAGTGFENMEAASYSVLQKLLKPGGCFYDVGAAIGSYSLLAASLVGENGKILSFEPDPKAIDFLNKHLAWNRASTVVTVRPVCVSSTETSRQLYVSEKDIGGPASLIEHSGFHGIQVASTTLDREYERCGWRPDLIKIDVEGAEFDVLKGAQKLLSEVRPAILLSLHPQLLEDQGISESQILDWLDDRGYQYKLLERDHEVHVLATYVA